MNPVQLHSFTQLQLKFTELLFVWTSYDISMFCFLWKYFLYFTFWQNIPHYSTWWSIWWSGWTGSSGQVPRTYQRTTRCKSIRLKTRSWSVHRQMYIMSEYYSNMMIVYFSDCQNWCWRGSRWFQRDDRGRSQGDTGGEGSQSKCPDSGNGECMWRDFIWYLIGNCMVYEKPQYYNISYQNIEWMPYNSRITTVEQF